MRNKWEKEENSERKRKKKGRRVDEKKKIKVKKGSVPIVTF